MARKLGCGVLVFVVAGILLWYFLARSPEGENEYFGKFSGDVSTRWLDDGRTMELLEPLVFQDANGLVWTAPKGSHVDGASIPQVLWNTIGSPLVGKYRVASVIHDVYCQNKSRRWESVHLNFYHAMRAKGVSAAKANAMYLAVRALGPRWPYKVERTIPAEWREVEVPAEYLTRTTERIVEPERREWVSEEVASNQVQRGAVVIDQRFVVTGPFGQRQREVRIRIPPVTEAVTEWIIETPATTRIELIPEHIETRIIDPPESTLTEEGVKILMKSIDGSESVEKIEALADGKIIAVESAATH